MGLFKRGRVWWMSFTCQGKQFRESTETENRKLAQKILDKTKGEIAEGKWFKKLEGDDRNFGEMVDKYMQEHSIPKKASADRDQVSLVHLRPYFEEYAVAAITPRMINEYKNKRREEGASPATINRELALTKHAFNLALKEWGWVAENPVMKVTMEKEPPARDRFLSYEEEESILSASPQWLKDIVIFAIETGCRRGEILSLQWKDVDLFKKVVTIFGKKTGERRTIPLTNKVFEVLKEREKTRAKVQSITEDLVFDHPPGRRLNINTLKWTFGEVLEKTKLKGVRFHDFRHTFASRLAQNGIDPYSIQKLMGHTSFSTTQRYAHHFVESLRRGIKSLEVARMERDQKNITNLSQLAL